MTEANLEGDFKRRRLVDEKQLSSTHPDHIKDLINWLSEIGVTGLDGIYFKLASCGTLGCFANKDFCKGDTIFAIPQEYIFSLFGCQHTALSKVFIQCCQKIGVIDQISKELILWINMIAMRGEDSTGFHIYFNSLDKCTPSLLSWDPVILESISETNLGNSLAAASNLLSKYAKLFDTIRQFLPKDCISMFPESTFNRTTLSWAYGHYLARRYPLRVAVTPENINKTAALDEVIVHKEDGLGNLGTIVPLLDILNHDHSENWLDLVVNDKDHKLYVNCNYPVKKVCIYYVA